MSTGGIGRAVTTYTGKATGVMTDEGYQPCIDEDCPDYAIWWLVAEDAGHRPPQRAFACDNPRHLHLALGTIFDNLMVCAGTINFQMSEEGFPLSPKTGKAT